MHLSLKSDPPPLREDDDGVVRVAATRIPLERVVRAFLAGSTPEQIAHDYDVLTLEDVYAVVNYYLQHRSEVDAYLAEVERDSMKIRDAIEGQQDSVGIRARLLARRSPKAD